jgi:hypothetical protein
MRKIWFLICVFGISGSLFAQSGGTSWSNLSSLHPGEKIQIVETSSKKHSGTFVNVSDSSISYNDGAAERAVPRQDVRSVRTKGNPHRMRNTLIGGAVGAGLGAGIGAGAWEDHGFLAGKGTGAAVCAGIGLLIGLVVGAIIPGHHLIYSAGSH